MIKLRAWGDVTMCMHAGQSVNKEQYFELVPGTTIYKRDMQV